MRTAKSSARPPGSFPCLEKDLEARDEKKLSFWRSFMRSLAAAPDTYVKPHPPAAVRLRII